MRILLTSALALALPVSAGMTTGTPGRLAGRVLVPPSGGPAVTAVWAGNISAPVARDGSFEIDALLPGPANVAIETSEGLFILASPVSIAPGTTRRVQLALGGRQDSSAPTTTEKDTKKKPAGVWARPMVATVIIVGSAVLVGVAIDDVLQNTNPAPAISPSTPAN
jgi:hypothetical protein